MSRHATIAGVILLADGATAQQSNAASVYLIGALSYQANAANGSDASEPGEYDTFSNTANSKMTIDGSNTDLSILLNAGATRLNVNMQYGTPVGLGLFFSTSAEPMTFPSGTVPDLVVVDPSSAANDFFTPAAGTQVGTAGQYSGTAAYSGDATYVFGGTSVTVTDFNRSNSSITLSVNDVSAIPEPSAVWTGLACLGGVGLRRRRI